MISHKDIDMAWQIALRAHASTHLEGDKGPYLPIGAKSMALLNPLWVGRSGSSLDLGALLAQGKDVRAFGDPHFEHANIIRMCERPFDSIESMDKTMWANLVQAHTEADFVLCVGDFAMKEPIAWQQKIAAEFPGKHATTVGNHDAKGAKPAQWLAAGAWASLAFSVTKELIKTWINQYEPKQSDHIHWDLVPDVIHVGVSHWPVSPERLPGPSWVNLHGHVHNRPNRPLRVNCSMEVIDFKPRAIAQLIDARLIKDVVGRQKGLASFNESSLHDDSTGHF